MPTPVRLVVGARDSLSGLDLAAVVRELSGTIEGSRLANIYQLDKNKFLLKLRRPGATHRLLVDLGAGAYLTSAELRAPEKPTGFCMGLRKDLRGGKLAGVGQHDLDRILVLTVKKGGEPYKLIFELFGGGNVVLVGSDGRIKRVLRPREMRDRRLLVGEAYEPPPRPPIDVRNVDASSLSALRDMGSIELVRGLSRATGLGGPYPEEVLLRAGVEKDRTCSSLTGEELELISRALSELVRAVLEEPLEPGVVFGPDERPIDVVPIRMRRYSGLKLVRFNTFNEALDAYFSLLERLRAREEISRAAEDEIRRLEEMLRVQEEALEKFRRKAEEFSALGNAIFSHLDQLNMLLEELRKMRDELGGWAALAERAEALRARGPPFSWITNISRSRLYVVVNLDGLEVELDVRKKAQDTASAYYEKAKKARRKARGAAEALEKTRRALEEARAKLAAGERAAVPIPRPKPVPEARRRAWYEQFRWFRSSDDLLIVAGKDAATNERLVKRYAEPGDLLLHADIPGAPFVLVKAGGREIPERTLLEAAEIAASYSRAWKYGLGAATVMCFRPEQARKIGPHGEKLPRGAFYISGSKRYIRGVRLNLAIGLLKTGEGPFRLVLGPVGAISSRTDAYVIIKPGDLKAEELVHEAIKVLRRRRGRLELPREEVERVKALVPYGRGAIAGGPS